MVTRKSDQTLHSLVQNAILRVVERLGLPVKTEYRGEDWRADVLVETPDRRFAFEVQTSNATYTDLRHRQARYLRDGIDCCWLVRKVPRACQDESPALPVFQITKANNDLLVTLIDGRRLVSLDNFVADYLKGRIQFRRTMTVAERQLIQLVFFEMECWNCGISYHTYYVRRPYLSCCDFEFDDSDFSELWQDGKLEFRPEIVAAVQQYLASENGRDLNLGLIKPRHSCTVDADYTSFGCPGCDAILGDWYYYNAVLDARNDESSLLSFAVTVATNCDTHLDLPHWCYPAVSHCVDMLPTFERGNDD